MLWLGVQRQNRYRINIVYLFFTVYVKVFAYRLQLVTMLSIVAEYVATGAGFAQVSPKFISFSAIAVSITYGKREQHAHCRHDCILRHRSSRDDVPDVCPGVMCS